VPVTIPLKKVSRQRLHPAQGDLPTNSPGLQIQPRSHIPSIL
jgi:hypothetical protein